MISHLFLPGSKIFLFGLGEVLEVVFDVLLEKFDTELEVLDCMVVCEKSVEVGYELLTFELEVVIEEDLTEHLKVSVHVKPYVSHRCLKEELHHMVVLFEVRCALDEVVHDKVAGSNALFDEFKV